MLKNFVKSCETFQDINYPGVTYVVPVELVSKFVSHMEGEGACLVHGHNGADEWKHVTDVCETPEYWGLKFREV